MTVKEIAWLAGLLEGEGTFGLANKGRTPCIWLSMTDGDVVEKARNLLDKSQNIRIAEDERKETYKKQYRISISGFRAIQWMMTLYPLMGLRRKAKMNEAILAWKTTVIDTRHGNAKAGLTRRLRDNGKSEIEVKMFHYFKALGFTDAEAESELYKMPKLKNM